MPRVEAMLSRSALGVLALGVGITVAAAIVGARLSGMSLRERPAAEAGTALSRDEASQSANFAKVHASYVEKSAEHFRILFEGGAQQAIGTHVARVLESEHARLATILEKAPSEPVTVVLYTAQTFHDLTRSPAWATGHYDGRIQVAVGGTYPPGALERILTHELVHAFVAASSSHRVPAWLDEGLATYLESTDRGWIPAALRGADALPFEALTRGFGRLDERSALVAYAESATAADILHARLGSKVGRLVSLVGDGASLDRALLELQVQPDTFHAEWRRRVGLQ